MNASNSEVPQEGQEREEEAPRFYDPIDYHEWFSRVRDDLTDEQREHVAQRTAFKEALAREAKARWGKGIEEKE